MIDSFQRKLKIILASQPIEGTMRPQFVEFIENNTITIEEKEPGGKAKISFTNGAFALFNKDALGTTKVNEFFNNQRGAVLKKICDGIFLAIVKQHVFLCLVELKKTVNYANFIEALKQVESSYLKTTMLLSLFTCLDSIHAAVFVVGNLKAPPEDPDIDYLEKTQEFSEKPHRRETKWKAFARNRTATLHLPHFLAEVIDDYYRKKDINIFHLESGDSFDLQTLPH